MSTIPRTPRPAGAGESGESDGILHRHIIGAELPANAAVSGVVAEGVVTSSSSSSPSHTTASTFTTSMQSFQSRQCDAPVRADSSVLITASPSPAVVSAAFGFTIRVVPAEGEAARPARSAAPRASRTCTATHLLSAPAPCMLLRRDSFWTLNHDEGVPQQPLVDNYVEAARLVDRYPALFEPPPSPRS